MRPQCMWLIGLSLSAYPPLFATPLNPTTRATSDVVDLGYAQYQGVEVQDEVTGQTNTQFLGIRFAAPPTGTLRFNAPSPPATTSGIQVADTQPPICIQAGPAGLSPINPFGQASSSTSTSNLIKRDTPSPPESEDCLFLNVVTPGQLGDNTNLPVVVWIYGGGYTVGSASITGFSTTIYDGNDLVRASGGQVVAVLIQYRLGLFGFLAGQEVKDGGALNAGLLDEQFAFQWVQQHISKFGGDPTKVTIWGESAGAGSVIQHLVAHDGNTSPSLFRAAMTSSTYMPPQYNFNDRIPELLYNATVSFAGCSSQTDTFSCLQQTDVVTLTAANQAILNESFFGTFTFVPVVDGVFITDRPSNLLRQKKTNADVVYSVVNSFEGTLFVNQLETDTVPTYISKLFPMFSSGQVQSVANLYTGLGSNVDQANLIMGESIFICPTYALLSTFPGTSFKGEFAVPPALHTADIPYYFNGGQVPPGANPDFAMTFAQSFMNFAQFLNPSDQPTTFTGVALSGWRVWNSGENEMIFNQTTSGSPDVRLTNTSTTLLERCQFWQGLEAFIPQ